MTNEQRANLAAAHATERARGRLPNIRMPVVEQNMQCGKHFRPRPGAPACIRADLGVAVLQQLQHPDRREPRPEPSSGGHRSLQTRPLKRPLGYQPSERQRCIEVANHRERVDRGSLFRHDPISPKTGMAPAHGIEGRDSRYQPAPSCFDRQSNAVADARPGEGGDQGAVVELFTRDELPGLTAGMTPLRRALLDLKDVELAVGSVSRRLSPAGKAVRWRPHYRAA